MLRIWMPVKFPGRNEQEAAARRSPYQAADMKKTYTMLAHHYARGALNRNGYLSGKWDSRISRKFRFIFSEKNRRRDPDNILGAVKFIMDGLVAAGVIENDGWKHVLSLEFEFRVADPGEDVGVLAEIW